MNLAAKLKQATAPVHALAERTGIMAELLRGRIDARTYAVLLRNLVEIYEPLEAALTRLDYPSKRPALFDAGLARVHRLCDDLEHLGHRHDWRQALPVFEAAAGYRQRIEQLSLTQPERLVAHAYVRYLGDLHGGQILGQIVASALGLAAGHGVRFYAFDSPPSVRERVAAFRLALDELALTDEQQQAIVEESISAFETHRRLFVQIADWRDPSA